MMIKHHHLFFKGNLMLLYPALVVLFSIGVIIGWSFNIEELKKVLPEAVSMNPLTAILFFCCSFIIGLNIVKGRHTRLAGFLSAVVFLAGALKIVSYFGNYHFGIDQLLFTDKLANERIYGEANEMAPNTAFNFSLLGLALLIYRTRGKLRLVSDILSFIVLFTAFLSIIGYLYDANELYVISNYIPMAVPTAVCFLLVSIAILLNRKGSLLLKTITNQYSGSRMARYLLPMAIILPLVLGLLRLYGQDAGFFSSNFGTALYAAVCIILFIFFILKNAATINRSDVTLHSEIMQRKRIEEVVRKSESMVKEFNKQLERKVEERTNELNRNRNMFRSLIENSVDTISMLDSKGSFLYSSVAVEKLIGYKPEELIKARSFVFIHPADLHSLMGLFQRVLTHPKIVYSSTMRILHKDGEYRWVEGTIINLLEDDNVKAIVTNFHDITEKKKAEETKLILEKRLLQEKIDKQIQITQATIRGQEKEKKEMGMELHDNVNQLLAAGKLYMDMAGSRPAAQGEWIGRSRENISLAIQEIRKLTKTMVPPTLGASGIIDSIKDFADVIYQSSGLQIDISVPKEILHALDENGQLALYRIIQEQLNNIVKHASAHKTFITLDMKSNAAILKIKDDGKGFDLTRNRTGIGLSNIQSRVEMLAGKYDIHSAPGQGCELIIQLPCMQ
jgi:PAS domain S-box-containing protein